MCKNAFHCTFGTRNIQRSIKPLFLYLCNYKPLHQELPSSTPAILAILITRSCFLVKIQELENTDIQTRTTSSPPLLDS